MELWALVIVTAGSLVLSWYVARGFRKVPVVPKTIIFADPASCKEILAGRGYNMPNEKNLYTDIESRAIPNKWLKLAFGIDNSFTTSDRERRREFNLEAAKAIKMTETKVSITNQIAFTFRARTFQEQRVLRFPSDCGLMSSDACTLDVPKKKR